MASDKKRKRPQLVSGLPSKRSKLTKSTKNFTYQSFTTRIASLRIDPIRRNHTNGIAAGEPNGTGASHFKTSLDNWTELNLSDNFSTFSRSVAPLTDSLVQLLHHADEVFSLILLHIKQGNNLSLQPLLDLIAQFARDLGVRFEQYFPSAFEAIANLASSNADVEVIEWSFNCLAWLFKYLSKLLIPDLRALYDAISPLLGKARQKSFVSRFAAEAFSFLIRRASISYHTNPRWLQNIVQHVIVDLRNCQDIANLEQFQLGLISLFAEAIRGTQEALSSTGDHVFTELLKAVVDSSPDTASDPAYPVLRGVVSTLLQATNERSFQALLQIIVKHPQPSDSASNIRLKVLSQVIHHNHGHMIEDWAMVFEFLDTLLTEEQSDSRELNANLVGTIAVCHNKSNLDVAIRYVSILEKLAGDQWTNYFLPFCDLYSRFGIARFKSFVLYQLQGFINKHWQLFQPDLESLIPMLQRRGLESFTIDIPQKWKDLLYDNLIQTEGKLDQLPDFAIETFAVIEMMAVIADQQFAIKYITKLWSIMSYHVSREIDIPVNVLLLTFGSILRIVITYDESLVDLAVAWDLLLTHAATLSRYPSFWQVAAIVADREIKLETTLTESPIMHVIDTALQSDCHDVRYHALSTLTSLSKKHDHDQLEILLLASAIETTTPSIDTFRLIGMQVRKLGGLYASQAADIWSRSAVPSYCFGLLRARYAPVWEAAVSALQTICETKDGAKVVGEIAMQWLEQDFADDGNGSSEHSNDETISNTAAPTNAAGFDALISALFRFDRDSLELARRAFTFAHPCSPVATIRDRERILILLMSVPQVAEKWSRALVPILLTWTRAYTANEDDDRAELISAENTNAWSRRNLKTLLSIFAAFANPRSMYKSEEVYESLLSLLSHGDVDIQRHALKAILSRKSPHLNVYRENLLGILDDDKLKDQFAGFLTFGAGDDSLRNEHRADVMPIVLRLLFGRIISRSRGDKQRAIKRAVFDLVSRLTAEEADCFLDIALGPLRNIELLDHRELVNTATTAALITPRKQIGLLNMLNDLLGFLGATTETYAARLIDPVLYCLLRAAQQERPGDTVTDSETPNVSKSINKSIRTSAAQCLNKLLEICPKHDWSSHVQLVWSNSIEHRLAKFQQETTEGVSWLLQIVSTWAQMPQYVGFLTLRGERLLSCLAECIGSFVTKEAVKHFIISKVFLPMLENLESAEVTEQVFDQVLSTSSVLLINLERALASDCSKDLLNDAVKLVSKLSKMTTLSSPELIKTCCALVRQPAQKISVPCKQILLLVIEGAISAEIPQTQVDDVFDLLCSSFTRGVSDESRRTLVEIAAKLATRDTSLRLGADLVRDLNSFSASRLDQPDFARRERAFGQIADSKCHFNHREWALLLANMMYFVTDANELSIRASATQSVRRFVNVVATSDSTDRQQNLRFLQDIVFVSIEKGMKDKPEIARVEYLSVLAEIVKALPSWERTRDLVHLIWSDDEETSFFNNILHIQQHRRIRALGRLAGEAQKGTLSSRNIAHLIIPLLEHFIFDENKAGEVAGEASKTIGKLTEWIDFPQFRSLFKRYISYLKTKPDSIEAVLKLLEHVAEAFGHAHAAKQTSQSPSALSKSMPKEDNLVTIVSEEFLPTLARFLQEKDESFVSRRVAAVVVAARILHVLPEREFAMKFPPMLTDTCNIMRSRDQNSREMTRKALMSICGIVGPGAFNFVIKELRRALQRGFFLHVLGYTVHALLESVMEHYQPGDLDHCVANVMEVVMDDVFGVTGQEKEAAEFLRDSQSKKEVKSRKSFDTIQLLGSVTSTEFLIELVRPINDLLLERLPHKMMASVDELLRRLEVGIAQNKRAADPKVLTFCFQIYQEAFQDPSTSCEDVAPARTRDAPIPDRWKERKQASLSSRKEKLSKLARFSLDLVRSVTRKHKELKTVANLAGLLPIIKDALVQDNEDCKLAALRLFTAIVAVPLPQIDVDAPLYLTEAVKIMDSSQTAKDELSQAALKLVAILLRERKSVKVSNEMVISLLKKIKPDLQIISQQGVAFNLIRSVMSRKIVVPEVYDLMDGDDGIAAIFVRDHDRTTRDLARGVYLQFVLEYPQAQKRFDRQLKFLIQNLEYEHPEGRMSVMEALNTLHLKPGDKMVQEVVKQSFWAVVSVMINDEAADCRAMAQGLLKTIFSRANDAWLETFMTTIQNLLSAKNQVSQQTAFQCWTIYLETKGTEAKGVDTMITTVYRILASTYDDPAEAWQLRFYTLNTFNAICKTLPSTGFDASTAEIWECVYSQMSFPHAWVKHEAAKLIGSLATCLITTQESLSILPLTTSFGLFVDSNQLFDLTRRHTSAFREGMTQDFASQLVRNLLFLGRCFSASDLKWPKSHSAVQSSLHDDQDAESEDDDDDVISIANVTTSSQSAVAFLFRRTAALLRRESHKRAVGEELASRRAASLIPRASALQLIAALVTTLPVENIRPSTTSILAPLIHLTDTNTTPPASSDAEFAEAYNALVTNATELLDIMQNKLGTTEFVSQLTTVKRAIGEKRDERRVKRRVEVIRNPQLVEKKRVQKREKEKVRRKEKSEMHRSRRRGW